MPPLLYFDICPEHESLQSKPNQPPLCIQTPDFLSLGSAPDFLSLLSLRSEL